MDDAAKMHAFLRSRRSIRRFKADPVPEEMLRRILETARYAPSAHNLQPWRFAVVRTEAAKARLGYALTEKMRADMRAAGEPESAIEARPSRSLRRLEEAPVVILLAREESALRTRESEEIHMSVQSVAIVGLQLLLAAHAEGLGGVWVCWPLYAPNAARRALNLPPSWVSQGMLFLGFPDESPSLPSRIPVEDVTVWR